MKRFYLLLLCFSSGCAPHVYVKHQYGVPPAEIVQTAESLLGSPYLYGGTSPQGFDCSGLLMYVFDKHSIPIPRTTSKQAHIGKKVKKENLKKGDLVFFHTKGIFAASTHSGIYIGRDKFIHAGTSHPAEVRIDSLDNPYYKKHFLFGRRILK